MTSARCALLSFFTRYFAVILILIIGAAIFMALENVGINSEHEKLGVKHNKNALKEEMQRKWSQMLNITINETVFKQLHQDMVQLKDVRNTWDMSTGTHFAFTVMSTIGYGVIVPTTDASKIVCILYAIISIPVFLYALAAAGEVKKISIEMLLQFIEIKIMKRNEVKKKNEKVLAWTVMLFFIEMILFSTIVYYSHKTWRYVDCVYFWFITASTIGFGDYVLSFQGNNRTDIVILLLSIIINLILQSGLATIFNTITEMVAERAEKRSKKRNCFCFKVEEKKTEVEEDNNVTDLQSMN